MDYTEYLPPVIRILINEDLTGVDTPAGMKSFANRLLPELRQQAKWTMQNWHYLDQKPVVSIDGFTITASGKLNPFSLQICSHSGINSKKVLLFIRPL